MPDIKVDRELEDAIANAQSPEEIVILMHQAAADQGLVPKETLGYRENWNPKSVADPIPTKKFERTENIGGKAFTFTATSEVELERTIQNARTVADAVQNDPNSPAARGRADEAAARKAELEAEFRAGRISADAYLEASGAVAEFLIARDIPLEAIQETVGRNIERSWAQASDEFVHSSMGADWPGGERNLAVLGMTIAALGLDESEDHVKALQTAWKKMKTDGLIFKEDGSPAAATAGTGNSDVTEEDFANATSYEELRQLARRSAGQDPTDAASSTAYTGR